MKLIVNIMIEFCLCRVLLLTIEYDVAIVDRGQFALHSPLLVEVEKSPCALLGIHLGTEGQKNRIGPSTGIFIESIEPASIAERYVNFIMFRFFFTDYVTSVLKLNLRLIFFSDAELYNQEIKFWRWVTYVWMFRLNLVWRTLIACLTAFLVVKSSSWSLLQSVSSSTIKEAVSTAVGVSYCHLQVLDSIVPPSSVATSTAVEPYEAIGLRPAVAGLPSQRDLSEQRQQQQLFITEWLTWAVRLHRWHCVSKRPRLLRLVALTARCRYHGSAIRRGSRSHCRSIVGEATDWHLVE